MGTIIKNGIEYGGGSSVELDTTLTVEGKAADAKAVGDAINVRSNNESGYLEVKVDGEWEQTELETGVSSTLVLLQDGVLNDKYTYTLTKTQNSGNASTGYYCDITTGEDGLLKFNASADSTASGGGYNTVFKYTSEEIDLSKYTKLIIENLSFNGGCYSYDNEFGIKIGGIGLGVDGYDKYASYDTLTYDISSIERGCLVFTLSVFKATNNAILPGYLYVRNVRLE